MKSWMICGRSSVVARIVFTAAAALNTNVYCIWIFSPFSPTSFPYHVVYGATWATLISTLFGDHCQCSVVSATVWEVRHHNRLLPMRIHFFLGFWGPILLTRSLNTISLFFRSARQWRRQIFAHISQYGSRWPFDQCIQYVIRIDLDALNLVPA